MKPGPETARFSPMASQSISIFVTMIEKKIDRIEALIYRFLSLILVFMS